jgi:FAD/FMN-containing dehydrogenase
MVASKEELGGIVGLDNVTDDVDSIELFSRDESFIHSMKPRFIVKPPNSSAVQALVQWAIQTQTSLVPVSSGPPHFRGDTVPSVPGAVMVDLIGMKKIVHIDTRNRIALIEPGVTYPQLQPELAKLGLKASTPLLPRVIGLAACWKGTVVYPGSVGCVGALRCIRNGETVRR